MGPARQFAAMMTVVVAFPLFLSWLLVHPFASVWRKLGGFTYIFVLLFLAGTIISTIIDILNDSLLLQ